MLVNEATASGFVLLRPLYRRAEEYQLLITFGLLLILEDVIFIQWRGLPLSADTLMDALPIVHVLGSLYPAYNLVVIGVGIVAALGLWARHAWSIRTPTSLPNGAISWWRPRKRARCRCTRPASSRASPPTICPWS